MKITSTILLLILPMASSVSAQDFMQTMKSLQDRYQNAENLRIKMSIDVFDAKGAQRSFYRDKITITKRGTSYRHHLSGAEMVMNDEYIVMVDRPSKKIIISKRNVKGEAKFFKQSPFNMDSILQTYEDGKFEGTIGNVNKFSATQEIGPIGKVELFVNKDTGELKQINYSYRAGQWATIKFEALESSPTFDENEFHEQQFVRKSGKTWRPATAFAGYEVVRADDAKGFAKN